MKLWGNIPVKMEMKMSRLTYFIIVLKQAFAGGRRRRQIYASVTMSAMVLVYKRETLGFTSFCAFILPYFIILLHMLQEKEHVLALFGHDSKY